MTEGEVRSRTAVGGSIGISGAQAALFWMLFVLRKKQSFLIQTVGCVWQIGTEIFAFCIGGFKVRVEDA